MTRAATDTAQKYCAEPGLAFRSLWHRRGTFLRPSPPPAKPTRDLAAPGERRRAHLEFEKLAEIELLPVLTGVADRADEAGEKAGPPF